ncbi:KGK domain-containing protein [Nostoc cycadae]|uniref:KGK family protein n=1 Tax=Nostoc cycadae WK-1 TaxID=1861711 RepID=A0A2H6LBJ9_9NOSO|nr:KGK domain-containing protein [Nostoc cycadae]GBE90553.1 KGK family protein [Nostoc cycadae WK-1]
MEYNSYLKEANDDEVLEFGSLLCKLGKFKQIINSALSQNLSRIINDKLKEEGLNLKVRYATGRRNSDGTNKYELTEPNWYKGDVNCQILKIGTNKGWQNGKFRIKIILEFCADEAEIEQIPEITKSESPLDDLRRKIDEVDS